MGNLPTMLLLLIAVAKARAIPPPPLPGTQLVGQAIDILTATRFGYTRSAGNIFKFNYNLSTAAFDKEYTYPWGMQQPAPISDCDRTVTTISVKTMDDYQRETTNDMNIGATYKSFGGLYSSSTKEVRRHLSEQNVWISESRTRCVKYQLTLLPGYAELDPMFLFAAKALPTKFTKTYPEPFFKFFDQWNTHFTTQCAVAGAMGERAFTKSTYTKHHTEEDVQAQAKASFIVSIDNKASSSTTVDKEFTQQTTFTGIEIRGGIPTGDKQWPDWMASVLALNNPVCLDLQAREIADVMTPEWTADSDLHLRAAAVKEALAGYFHRPGCMNPLFPNYDEHALQDDGSCGPRVASLRMRAYIDLEDSVYVGNGKQLRWLHVRGVDVGRQDGHNDPVTLTFTMSDGKVHELDWYPQQSRVFSSPFLLNYCAAAKFTKHEGRDSVYLIHWGTEERPENEVKFIDNPKGAAWYAFELSWNAEDACPSPTEHAFSFTVCACHSPSVFAEKTDASQ